MTRIQIAATITTSDPADVFALHPAVMDAATVDVVFTVDSDRLLVNVGAPDVSAVLMLLDTSDALGQIDVYASKPHPLAAAA
ncbi:hypothetical protein AB0331_15690 [Dietzia maris]|uniref:hypothetical protein n=1 Tax=Dietzia maris TaxID=37915 RepID=UPI00344FF8B1